MKYALALILLTLPACAAPVYLDFDGNPAFIWDSRQIPATPAYAGDAAEVVRVVARLYQQFNVTITTTPTPGALHVIIGGNGSWFPGVTGVTNLFEVYEPNPTAFVFAEALGNDARAVGATAAHEMGHALAGLQHQSAWVDSVKVQEYRAGWVMGLGFATADDPVWGVGLNSAGQVQDDVALMNQWVGAAVPETTWGMVAMLGVWVLGRRAHSHRSISRKIAMTAPTRSHQRGTGGAALNGSSGSSWGIHTNGQE